MTSVGNYKGSDHYQGAGRHEPGPALASHVKDPRLVLLDGLVPGLFADGSAVLDIGCNAGAVTVQIAHFYDTHAVIGVDVDSDLVQKASKHYVFQASRLHPTNPKLGYYYPISAILDMGPLPSLKFTDDSDGDSSGDLYDDSIEDSYGGFIDGSYGDSTNDSADHSTDDCANEPTGRDNRRRSASVEPASTPAESASAEPASAPVESIGRNTPHRSASVETAFAPVESASAAFTTTLVEFLSANAESASVESASVASAATPDQQTVEFFCEDWATSKNDKTSGPFDVILALNVVKWIHLQHLDQGLETFFRKCASSLKAGGYFVIEVQPWKSYLSAIHPKKAPHFKGNLELLKHRPETSYTELLEQNGLIHVATSEELPRRISVYRKEEELRGGLTSGDPE